MKDSESLLTEIRKGKRKYQQHVLTTGFGAKTHRRAKHKPRHEGCVVFLTVKSQHIISTIYLNQDFHFHSFVTIYSHIV